MRKKKSNKKSISEPDFRDKFAMIDFNVSDFNSALRFESWDEHCDLTFPDLRLQMEHGKQHIILLHTLQTNPVKSS